MYTKDNSEIASFGAGILAGMVLLAIILAATKLSPNEMEKKAQKEAVAHGAAHYIVDTNGVVSFEWNK
jgi:Pyruvate/2-oxoacid:ferredoxin oxidoreductase gamma subunit